MSDKMIVIKKQVEDFNTIISFLAQSDIEDLSNENLNKFLGFEQADLLIIIGNSIPYIAESGAKAYKKGISKELMIVGGQGHSTKYLRDNIKKHHKYKNIQVLDRTEADILKDLLVQFEGINENYIIIENQSTNCGSNAYEALNVLKKCRKDPKSIIIMQDPTMQFRTYASFQKAWSQEGNISFINYPTFIPLLKLSHGTLSYMHDSIYGLWDITRFLSLVMGEIYRLTDNENGYGPNGKGYIHHIDIPKEVSSAYERLLPFYDEYIYIRNRKL
jgi:uncharacterized SAM-binding protein YcdF (DUF218 family)